MKAYQIKIAIKNLKPPVWRRCIIPAGMTFFQLGILLNEVMECNKNSDSEFEFYHRKIKFLPNINETDAKHKSSYEMMDGKTSVIDSYFDGEEWCTYQIEDGYSCRVDIEAVIADYENEYPVVEKAKGSCPDHSSKEYPMDAVNIALKNTFAGFSKDIVNDQKCKNIHLQEVLDYYKEEDLKKRAEMLKIDGAGDMDKAGLIDVLTERLLQPESLRSWLFGLMDTEYHLFDELSSKEDLYRPEKEHLGLLRGLLEYEYVVMYEDEMVEIPEDVKRVFKEEVKTEAFEVRREEIVWLRKCMEMATLFYGSAPRSVLTDMFNRKAEYDINIVQMEEIFNEIPEEKNPCVMREGKVIAKVLLQDDLYKRIEEFQGDKAYYIPTEFEVESYMKNGYPAQEDSYHYLKLFLEKDLNMDPIVVTNILRDIYRHICLGYKFESVMDYLEERGIHISLPDVKDRLNYLMISVNNHTRMMMNRGYMPCDDIPKQGKPFDGKKIYPNDPCPCGSGLKYKKCCGRNK